MAKASKDYDRFMKCEALLRRRESIDRAGIADAMKDARFKVRQEQFDLRCDRT